MHKPASAPSSEPVSLRAAVERADALRPPEALLPVRLLSYGEFLKNFTPPDFLVFGMLQRGFLYALTAPSGAGKTAAALLLSTLAGSVGAGATFAGREVEVGNVLYLCAENPDDIRMRLIGMRAKRLPDTPDPQIWFEPVRRPLADMLVPLAEQAPPGGFHLVIVDTAPAYYPAEDENSNVAMGDHARALRWLTDLPGHPCVLALCHPAKHAAAPTDLIPRGGGAFNNEIDGNLTLWKPDGEDKVTLHHLKMRGPGFEPVEFKLDPVTTTDLVDSKKRLIATVRLRPLGEEEAIEDAERTRRADDAVLREHGEKASLSRADCARRLGWVDQKGAPQKSKVDRSLKRLKRRKLVDIEEGGAVTLTKTGQQEADRLVALRALQ